MPRTSAAALAVVPLTAPEQLAPPRELSAPQRRIWTDIVSSRPPEFFDRACQELLISYCRHADQANDIARLLRRQDPDDLAALNRLHVMAARETAAIVALSAKLRLAPQNVRRIEVKVPKAQGRKWAPID